MPGTVLENLSGFKLLGLVFLIFICQIICFLVGGIGAPAPSNVDPILGTKCLSDRALTVGEYDHVWHIPRGTNDKNINCNIIDVSLDDPSVISNPNITPNHLVFAFQAPLPKDGYVLDYSRWMQNLIAVLQMDIAYSHQNPVGKDPIITFDVKLGYRNKWDPDEKWTLIANSTETRQLECSIPDKKKIDGYHYDCNLLPLFELGSLHHDYYLLNLRLPIDMTGKNQVNDEIGHIDDIWLVVINQNGGFTLVWVTTKTAFLPIILIAMVWYWRRISLLSRSAMLVEKMLMAVAISLTLLNLPVEFLTLYVELPFMLLLSDIRQGIFYAALLSFWLVFCGEHLVDDIERNKLRSYWRYLTSVAVCCFCLFLFDMCERGVQLKNPFFSIWYSKSGARMALGFIVLAGIAACLYFLFLCYLGFKVIRNITYKRNAIPNMSHARRMYYEGIIYRFYCVMGATFVCAGLTVISYIIGEASEGRWKWDDNIKLDYTSAFFTGVYGMWNLYVLALLILYAPSHKNYPHSQSSSNPSTQEEIEFSRLTTSEPSPAEPTEISALTGLAQKVAFD